MNGESDTPFEQLTEAQQEELVEAMYQIYSNDIEGLIREFLKRHGASESLTSCSSNWPMTNPPPDRPLSVERRGGFSGSPLAPRAGDRLKRRRRSRRGLRKRTVSRGARRRVLAGSW